MHIIDMDWAVTEEDVQVYLLAGRMNAEGQIDKLCLGILPLEKPMAKTIIVDWEDEPEVSQEVEMQVDIGELWAPNGVTQGTWCRANKLHKVRVHSKGPLSINGQSITADGVNELTLNQRIVGETSLTLKARGHPVMVNNLEVAFLVQSIAPD